MKEAVSANFALHGLSGAAGFLATNQVSWDNASSKIGLIGMQKWVSLCMVNHFEAWAEARRLDVPKFSELTADQVMADQAAYTPGDLIVPMVNYLGSDVVRRLPFPEDAVNLNDNTPDQKGVATRVWWDVK